MLFPGRDHFYVMSCVVVFFSVLFFIVSILLIVKQFDLSFILNRITFK